MFYVEVAWGITGYFFYGKSAEARRQLEVIKKSNLSLNLVEFLREIEEREAKHEECWLLMAMVKA